jgi:hypothetical protein
MTPSTLTLARPATPSLKPAPTTASLLKAVARSVKAPDSAPDTVDAARTAATSLDDMQKQRRQSLKDQAKAQVMALLERIRTLKQFASDNPQVMAKQLAAIVRELKSALKAYAAAGGTPGIAAASAPAAPPQAPVPANASDDIDAKAPADDDAEVASEATEAPAADVAPSEGRDAGATLASTPAATDADPRNVYERMRDSVSGSEAAGDMDFVKLVRGVGKVIRDLLTKAKLQTALKGPGDETKKNFEAADKGLKELDEALDRMDRDIRNSSPAAGMFVALYA